jgi:hypothetical protein
VDLDYRHLRSRFVEVDVVRERLGLVRLEERDEICDPYFHRFELPLADIGAVDDKDCARHSSLPTRGLVLLDLTENRLDADPRGLAVGGGIVGVFGPAHHVGDDL